MAERKIEAVLLGQAEKALLREHVRSQIVLHHANEHNGIRYKGRAADRRKRFAMLADLHVKLGGTRPQVLELPVEQVQEGDFFGLYKVVRVKPADSHIGLDYDRAGSSSSNPRGSLMEVLRFPKDAL